MKPEVRLVHKMPSPKRLSWISLDLDLRLLVVNMSKDTWATVSFSALWESCRYLASWKSEDLALSNVHYMLGRIASSCHWRRQSIWPAGYVLRPCSTADRSSQGPAGQSWGPTVGRGTPSLPPWSHPPAWLPSGPQLPCLSHSAPSLLHLDQGNPLTPVQPPYCPDAAHFRAEDWHLPVQPHAL